MKEKSLQIIDLFKTSVAQFVLQEDTKALTQFAHHWAKNHPSVNISNKGGYQSPALPLDIPELQSLRQEANRCFNKVRKLFYYNRELGISNMWLNINSPKSYNSPHDHPFSFLSSCFYISTPEKSGKIVFYNRNPIENFIPQESFTEYGWYNSPEWTLPAKENYFYIFPSWLQHSVQQNNSSEDRISISINAADTYVK